MSEPYINRGTSVNKFNLPNNDLAEGSTIRFVRAWREDELPDARNFPTAVIEAVKRTASGFAIYMTTAGPVWFDRVLEVVALPATAAQAA